MQNEQLVQEINRGYEENKLFKKTMKE